ncbi:MAG: ECF transporter S component [Clostridiales bacterium]|jgi:uncharacterized membrane protein|nr:ECF transporter S component [Clostridiales bacterium]
MNKSKDQMTKLTLTAMFFAIIIALTFIPYTGYIVYGLLSITTIHVVVILGAVVLGPARGTLLGLVWGITCLLYALMNGTADAVIFLDPRISVIPRILVGLAAGWYYRGFSRVFRRVKGGKIIAAAITGALGTLTNTVLVLTSISLFGSAVATLGSTLETIIKTAFALNGVVELLLAVVVVPAVARPILQIMKRYGSVS